jgi:hypothetical protein
MADSVCPKLLSFEFHFAPQLQLEKIPGKANIFESAELRDFCLSNYHQLRLQYTLNVCIQIKHLTSISFDCQVNLINLSHKSQVIHYISFRPIFLEILS